MAEKPRILFICQHNSGRSQMAEAFLKRLAGDHLEVASTGLEPAPAVNPLVVKVMQEEGIDLTAARPQSVFELFKAGRLHKKNSRLYRETSFGQFPFPFWFVPY